MIEPLCAPAVPALLVPKLSINNSLEALAALKAALLPIAILLFPLAIATKA